MSLAKRRRLSGIVMAAQLRAAWWPEVFVGIDPGVTGGIAVMDGARLVSVHRMPVVEVVVGGKKRNRVDAAGLVALLRSLGEITHAVVEQVGARPREGAVGAFSFGRGFGVIEGVLSALGIEMRLALPQAWKKKAGLIGASKTGSRDLAKSLWPVHASAFLRVNSDGLAESALIGTYG